MIILLNDSIHTRRTSTLLLTVDGCMRGVGSLINHKPKKNANAKFIFFKTGVFVYAKEDIYEGEEIFADYGSSYIFKKNFNTYKKNVIVF